MTDHRKYEYINDYLYFVVRRSPNRGTDAWVYCSGINVTRFSKLTQGRHGLSSNPMIRGLQLLKHSISRLAIARGARPKLIRDKDCAGITPTPEVWYSEILLIEDVPVSLPADIIEHCIAELFEKILAACCPAIEHPGRPLAAEELQDFIAGLSPRT